MSTNESVSPSSSHDSNQSPEPLGSRENFWGELNDEDDDSDETGGHSEVTGTDRDEYVAFQLALDFLDPICTETGRPLSEPKLHVPKEVEVRGRRVDYGQFRHRRRVEPESGRINWGESTSTGVPEFEQKSTYMQACHNHLARRYGKSGRDGLTVTNIDEYLEYANRQWHDPNSNSHEALTKFVRHVRVSEKDK